MRDAFVQTTADLLDADPRVAVVLADIGVGRFAEVGAIRRHPDRVLNMGIREALAVGAAAGLALEGFVPIIHSYAPFLVERAFEQIKLDLVHQALPGVLVSIGGSYDASVEGRTHQSPGDVAVLSTLPGMRIELPGHPDEVAPAMLRARAHGGASYIRLSSQVNPRAFGPGSHVVRDGARGTVVCLGPLLGPVLAATAGLDVRVVYTSNAVPLPESLREAVLAHGPIVWVEPLLQGTTLGAASALFERPVTALGVDRLELRRYGTPADHAAAHGLDEAGLRRQIAAVMARTEGPEPSRRLR